MLALASAMGIGRFVYTPILPAMADALGLTKAEAGLIASANFAGYLAGALLTGVPRLPGSRRAWFLAALLVGALTMAAMGLGEGMAAFLPLRFAGGVASAFALVLGSALIIDQLAASGRGGLSALHFGGVGLGIAASAVLVDVLQAAGAGWRDLWFASAALAGAVIPVCAALIPPGDPPPAARPAAEARTGAAPPGLGRLNLCHGLFGFGYVVTATFLVAAVRSAPAGHALEAVVWIVVGLAALPSTAIWVRAGTLWGALSAYGLACLVESAGVAVGGLWLDAAGALIATHSFLLASLLGAAALLLAAIIATQTAREPRVVTAERAPPRSDAR
jgi:MFS family permease